MEDIDGIFIVAITARPDLIDPAVIRAGRIDQHILCDLPKDDDRAEFFSQRLKLLNCSEDCLSADFIQEMTKKSKGFSYANLAGYLRNLQIVFFDKLSKYDASESKESVDPPILLKVELLETLKKSEAFGESIEYQKLEKIYQEFSKKGLVADQPGSKGQILQ